MTAQYLLQLRRFLSEDNSSDLKLTYFVRLHIKVRRYFYTSIGR